MPRHFVVGPAGSQDIRIAIQIQVGCI
jgi:hypothetical protein